MSLKYLIYGHDDAPNIVPKRGKGRGPVPAIDLLPKAHGSGPKKGIGTPPEISPVKRIELSSTGNRKSNSLFAIPDTLYPHLGPQKGFGQFGDVVPQGPKKGTVSGMESINNKEAEECLRLTNEFRAKHGLPPLKFSKELSQIALPHTQDMLSGKLQLGHEGFKQRAAQAKNATLTGENVAYCDGYSDPVKIMVDGWIKSPPHRKNLLGNFNTIGISLCNRGSLWYGTQFFAYY